MASIFIKMFPHEEIVTHVNSAFVPRQGESFVFEETEYEVWKVEWELKFEEIICYLTLTIPIQEVLRISRKILPK